MNAAKAFANSLKWSFIKQDYSYLIEKEGCSFFSLKERIKSLFEAFRHCYGQSRYDLDLLAMKIDSFALKKDTPLERYLLSKAQNIKERLKETEKSVSGSLFPSYQGKIRVDALAEEIVKARVFSADSGEYAKIKNYCFCNFELEQREREVFDSAFEIAKCKVFCALIQETGKEENNEKIEALSALLFNYQNDLQSLEWSKSAEETLFKGEKLSARLHYGGKSKLSYEGAPLFYESGFEGEGAVNYLLTEKEDLILSSFDFHKFSQDLFMFYHEGKGLKITCKVLYKGNSEIRQFCIENLYKTNRNLTFKLSALPFIKGGFYAEEITVNGKKGVQWGREGQNYFMCASMPYKSRAALFANGVSARYIEEFCFKINKGEKLTLNTALTFASSLEELTQSVEKAQNIDSFQCAALFTKETDRQPLDLPPRKTCRRFLLNAQPLPLIKYLKISVPGKNKNFLLDEKGVAATLYGGYLTAPQGEQIYLAYKNKIVRLTGEAFTKTQSGGEYHYKNAFIEAEITLSHFENKRYDIKIKKEKPCQASLLFVFNFKKQITFEYGGNGFLSGACEIKLSGKALSYTCARANYDSENALLYADGKLSRSDFLAFDCAVEEEFCLELAPAVKYINYNAIFCQNPYAENLYKEAKRHVYLYSNALTPLSALTLSACAYASLDFLKEYLTRLKDNGCYAFPYYDCSGEEKSADDGYAFALALVNYTLLCGDKSLYADGKIKTFLDSLLSAPPDESNRAEALLLLVKAAELTPRNSPLLLAAQDLIKDLSQKEKRKAELIGALKPRENSEQYIFSLLEEFPEVPSCYAYITLFERLYGVKLNAPLLCVKPQEGFNPLPLSINFCGKSYSLDFQRGSPSLKLNNLIMLPLLDCSNVHKGENKITVFH